MRMGRVYGPAARRIQGAFRKYIGRKRFAGAFRKKRYVVRSAMTKNNEPTYVETFRKDTDNVLVQSGRGVGSTFKVRISDVPQWLQYANLYKQYRINWVKVILLPTFNTSAAEINMAGYNGTAVPPTNFAGQARIVYVINDTPNEQAPATEQEILQDNGCKIKAMGSKFTASFKPVPDVQAVTAVGNIYTRQKFKQWFNFDVALAGNNPTHGALDTFITLPGVTTPGAPDPAGSVTWTCYYKVSFTLRDPK